MMSTLQCMKKKLQRKGKQKKLNKKRRINKSRGKQQKKRSKQDRSTGVSTGRIRKRWQH